MEDAVLKAIAPHPSPPAKFLKRSCRVSESRTSAKRVPTLVNCE
ncbi:MAG TPA: hypothetical protein V6C90_11835 [Coleofasciculaceae cyanobacterium]